MKKKIITAVITVSVAAVLAGCSSSDANIVSENISKEADQFKIERRIVFVNGITDKYLLSIEGFCSIDTSDAKKLAVTCKTGPDSYKKHYLGLSDNVTYFEEQLDSANVSANHYLVIFKPESIIPDIQRP